MKKIIGLIFGIIVIIIIGAVALCFPTYRLIQNMEDNRNLTLHYTLSEDDSDLYRIAQILGVTDGRIEGYGSGSELWQFALYGNVTDKPYAVLYMEKPEADHCYVNVTILGNYIKSVIGEQIPILQGVLKESDRDRYLSLGQLEEITGLSFDVYKLGEVQENMKQAMKLLPLVNLIPPTYEENDYKYYKKDEWVENLSIGIPGFRTDSSRGLNVRLEAAFAGGHAQADLWLRPEEARELALPGKEDFISADEVRIIREFWGLCKNLLLG